MAAERVKPMSPEQRRGCCLWTLVAAGAWLLLATLGGLRGLPVVTVIIAGALVLRWRWRAWFPHRATRELNKIIGRARVEGRARLLRRKCRRDGYQWEVAWRVPTGVTTTGLMRAREVLEHALDCSATFWFERGLMWMRAGTAHLPDLISYEEFYRQPAPAGELVFGVGVGRTGPVWLDLTTIPHVLIGGTPGAGKSVWLRQALMRLVLTYGPEHLRLVLVDLKGGMEFQLFRRLPHRMLPVVSDLPEIGPALDVVLAELVRRQGMLAEAGAVSVQEWNTRFPDRRLPYIVVVVDEYGEVSLPPYGAAGEQAKAHSPKVAGAGFSRIARLGRALGIHLLVCTQRPDAEVVQGQVKAQLPATVAFRTRGESNSHVLLGETNDAAALLPPRKGRAVFQWETEGQVQGPWLSVEDAARLLAERYPVATGSAVVAEVA
jgi:S-DNA-T family DNA segregation ATPase FtsK/SpoIIIE